MSGLELCRLVCIASQQLLRPYGPSRWNPGIWRGYGIFLGHADTAESFLFRILAKGGDLRFTRRSGSAFLRPEIRSMMTGKTRSLSTQRSQPAPIPIRPCVWRPAGRGAAFGATQRSVDFIEWPATWFQGSNAVPASFAAHRATASETTNDNLDGK
jgi:hypothetical protein